MPGFKMIIKSVIPLLNIYKNKLIRFPTADIDQDSGKSKQQKANNSQEFVVGLCPDSLNDFMLHSDDGGGGGGST